MNRARHRRKLNVDNAPIQLKLPLPEVLLKLAGSRGISHGDRVLDQRLRGSAARACVLGRCGITGALEQLRRDHTLPMLYISFHNIPSST